MVEAAREGSFVPEARHDILVEAIGTEEHGGRVRGVGEDVGLRSFFGSQRKSTESQEFREQKQKIENVEKKLEEQRREFEEEREKREKEMERFKELYTVCDLLEIYCASYILWLFLFYVLIEYYDVEIK